MEADPKPTSPGVTRQIHPDLPKDLKNFVGQEKPFGLVLMAHLSSQKLSRLSMVKSKIPTYEAKTSGFFEAVYHAYFNHLPLKLSPDHIWLTILQGVAFHINNNSEVLRSQTSKTHLKNGNQRTRCSTRSSRRTSSLRSRIVSVLSSPRLVSFKMW